MKQKILNWLYQKTADIPCPQAPSDEELLQLSEGTLTPERRRQVLAYLASDSERLHNWVQLHEALDVAAVKPHSIVKSKPPLGRLSFAASLGVMALVAIMVIPPQNSLRELDQLIWPNDVQARHWTVAKGGLRPALSEQQRNAFAAGVRDVLANAPSDATDWQSIHAWYGEQSTSIQCPDNCDDEALAAWQHGRWATWTRLACMGQQNAILETLEPLQAELDLPALENDDKIDETVMPAVCWQAFGVFNYYE